MVGVGLGSKLGLGLGLGLGWGGVKVHLSQPLSDSTVGLMDERNG